MKLCEWIASKNFKKYTKKLIKVHIADCYDIEPYNNLEGYVTFYELCLRREKLNGNSDIRINLDAKSVRKVIQYNKREVNGYVLKPYLKAKYLNLRKFTPILGVE